MTNDKDNWHELPGPHAHERGKVVKPRLAGGRRPDGQTLPWILLAGAIAATAAGVVLALGA